MNHEYDGVAVIIKKTSSLGTLLIKPICKQLARDIIIEHHYSHKWNNATFGVYNIGIFRNEEPDICLGVATYGYIKNQRYKLFSHPNPDAWLCELNRLWIDDQLGKNAESILISCSIKIISKMNPNIVAVQSFADGRLGCGTIYQAANFKYYGYHYTRFLRNTKTDEFVHSQNFRIKRNRYSYLLRNVGYLLGDYEIYKVKTYRYIYSLSKDFIFHRKELPYPPYDKGMELVEWDRDILSVKENLKGMIDSFN